MDKSERLLEVQMDWTIGSKTYSRHLKYPFNPLICEKENIIKACYNDPKKYLDIWLIIHEDDINITSGTKDLPVTIEVWTWFNGELVKKHGRKLYKYIIKLQNSPPGPNHPEAEQLVYDLKSKFTNPMDDDFNIAPALAALFQFTKEVNRVMEWKGISETDKIKFIESLKSIGSVLGILEIRPVKSDKDIESLIEQREKARMAEDWGTADRIRNELGEKGIELIDTKDGVIWRSKSSE